jgi:hypothetical protein
MLPLQITLMKEDEINNREFKMLQKYMSQGRIAVGSDANLPG